MTFEEGLKSLELLPTLLDEVQKLREEIKEIKSFKVKSISELEKYIGISHATAYKLINDGILIKNIHYTIENGVKIWNMKKLQEFKFSYKKGSHKINNNAISEAIAILKAS